LLKYFIELTSYILLPELYHLLMHYQNLHQYGANAITKIHVRSATVFLIAGSLSKKLPWVRYANVMPISTSGPDIEVNISAKKKSLNLTLPKGAISIYQMT